MLPDKHQLCACCASRGSGSAELDDRAASLLEQLRGDERLAALGVTAQHVVWTQDEMGFLFSSRDQPVRLPRARLVMDAPGPLVDALVTCLRMSAIGSPMVASY